jgi:hypothetical protein
LTTSDAPGPAVPETARVAVREPAPTDSIGMMRAGIRRRIGMVAKMSRMRRLDVGFAGATG